MRSIKKPNIILQGDDFKRDLHKKWPVFTLQRVDSSITATGNTFLFVSATTNVNISLPPLSQGEGYFYYIGKLDGTANVVHISGAVAAEDILGSGSYEIASQNTVVQLVGDSQELRWVLVSIFTT